MAREERRGNRKKSTGSERRIKDNTVGSIRRKHEEREERMQDSVSCFFLQRRSGRRKKTQYHPNKYVRTGLTCQLKLF